MKSFCKKLNISALTAEKLAWASRIILITCSLLALLILQAVWISNARKSWRRVRCWIILTRNVNLGKRNFYAHCATTLSLQNKNEVMIVFLNLCYRSTKKKENSTKIWSWVCIWDKCQPHAKQMSLWTHSSKMKTQ